MPNPFKRYLVYIQTYIGGDVLDTFACSWLGLDIMTLWPRCVEC